MPNLVFWIYAFSNDAVETSDWELSSPETFINLVPSKIVVPSNVIPVRSTSSKNASFKFVPLKSEVIIEELEKEQLVKFILRKSQKSAWELYIEKLSSSSISTIQFIKFTFCNLQSVINDIFLKLQLLKLTLFIWELLKTTLLNEQLLNLQLSIIESMNEPVINLILSILFLFCIYSLLAIKSSNNSSLSPVSNIVSAPPLICFFDFFPKIMLYII